jgi:hypothetical protein
MLDHNTLNPGNQHDIVVHLDYRFMNLDGVVGACVKVSRKPIV